MTTRNDDHIPGVDGPTGDGNEDLRALENILSPGRIRRPRKQPQRAAPRHQTKPFDDPDVITGDVE